MPNAVWCGVGILSIVGALFIIAVNVFIALMIKQYFSSTKGWSCGRFMKIVNKIKDKKKEV